MDKEKKEQIKKDIQAVFLYTAITIGVILYLLLVGWVAGYF